MRSHSISGLTIAIALALGGAQGATAVEKKLVFDASVLKGMSARNIGSARMSGRISALDAVEIDGKITIFVGSASGGIWKSEDGGTRFRPIFDKQPVQSIGAVRIDPSNPKTIWVGTGETWTRNSVSLGDGIYKSTDGGENWTHMGLPNAERINKIIVHPSDSNTVYACVPGKLWSDSKDRGLYKTSDGGSTWKLILAGSNLSTGCSGISLDPRDPNQLLVGMWDFRRQAWTFRSGGAGPEQSSGSGLYRSANGGATFTELTASNTPGMPAKPYGRIEVEHAPSNGDRVYAFVEGIDSALLVSDDGAKSFEARDKSQNMVWRPFYFANLIVDPTNADRVFKVNLNLIVSDDAGRSFSGAGGNAHADWHDVWVNPKNPQHIIGGDDGGLWISQDGMVTVWKVDNLPISQFYHVSVDNKDPYMVYGGLQDNNTWMAPSAAAGGIGNEEWDSLYGGDGFWVFPDPTDENYIFAEYQGGNIALIDRRTMAARDIQPKASAGEKLRFHWNAPLHMSARQPRHALPGRTVLVQNVRSRPKLAANIPRLEH